MKDKELRKYLECDSYEIPYHGGLFSTKVLYSERIDKINNVIKLILEYLELEYIEKESEPQFAELRKKKKIKGVV